MGEERRMEGRKGLEHHWNPYEFFWYPDEGIFVVIHSRPDDLVDLITRSGSSGVSGTLLYAVGCTL